MHKQRKVRRQHNQQNICPICIILSHVLRGLELEKADGIQIMGRYGFSVWIGGLSESIRTRDVEEFVRGYGKILDISLKQKYGRERLLRYLVINFC